MNFEELIQKHDASIKDEHRPKPDTRTKEQVELDEFHENILPELIDTIIDPIVDQASNTACLFKQISSSGWQGEGSLPSPRGARDGETVDGETYCVKALTLNFESKRTPVGDGKFVTKSEDIAKSAILAVVAPSNETSLRLYATDPKTAKTEGYFRFAELPKEKITKEAFESIVVDYIDKVLSGKQITPYGE